jgi:hypothetical protein
VLRRTLDRHDYDQLPELVSMAELAKQSQQCVADADMACWLVEKATIDAPLAGKLQNEAKHNAAWLRRESA